MPSPNWIHTLKRALGHYDEPYPGTPAYNHRRRLTESLSKIWRSHLHNLVLSDLQAGLHGRRKHFWEEMECIVAYELQPSTILGLLDEQRATGLLGLNTLDHLALHATYIFCPGFSGKNICSVRLVISILFSFPPRTWAHPDSMQISDGPNASYGCSVPSRGRTSAHFTHALSNIESRFREHLISSFSHERFVLYFILQ